MPRRILLCATGLSPQVVTETLFSLATSGAGERFVPDEVHVVTTTRGAEAVRLMFIDERANQLARLCEQHALPMPKVRLHLIQGPEGPLDDLRTAAHNDAAADSILQVVRELTAKDDAAIHFSIAGGRKTMGYYLGTCASLLGRPQDRMSHVLVNEPFESAPEFFFPPRPPQILQLRGGPADTARARIDLAPVSFIRLRSLLPAPLISKGSFTELVAVVDGMLVSPSVVLRIAPRPPGRNMCPVEVEIAGGLKFDLAAKSFALYWLLAQQAMRGEPWIRPAMDAQIIRRDFLEIYRLVAGVGTKYDAEAAYLGANEGQFTPKAYQDAINRLSNELKKKLGGPATRIYGPQGRGRSKALEHALMLPAEAIRLERATTAR
ncbi:MAG: TIGR02584 family CRISPR-associated protein [Rubrivivax sp.]|nr:TIGR02584 family CRISPR-associated protein [Rubrivivax sp.]